jgi:DNA polymerase-3 subunit alpha
MNITSFDPLENGLMFERFYHPQRTEMPDIDMDFDDERRLEVVQHVRELYGNDRVCHVITYSTIKAKQAINAAARVLGMPVWQGQRLSKMLSNDPRLQLSYALKKNEKKPDQFSPEFAEAYEKDADARRIIDAALAIEGLTRGEGVHACAVLIAPPPVNDHVPTKLDTKGGVEITQYEGHSVADMGPAQEWTSWVYVLTVISKATCPTSAPAILRKQISSACPRRCARPSARVLPVLISTSMRFPSRIRRSMSLWDAAIPQGCSRANPAA